MSTQPTIYSRFPRSNLIMIYFMSLNYRLSHELCSNTRDKNDGSLAYIISPSQKTKAFFFIIIRPEQKVHRPCRFTKTQYKKKVYKTDDNMNTQINNILHYTYVQRHGKGEKIYSKTNFLPCILPGHVPSVLLTMLVSHSSIGMTMVQTTELKFLITYHYFTNQPSK